ncbi:MAG: T9SS type A sorting domain-containing protein [Mucilaginibacter sp.]
MKSLFKPLIVVLLVMSVTKSFGALTYDWNGKSGTGGNLWNVAANWKLSTGSVPTTAPSLSTDIIRIGIGITSFSVQPVISSNVSCASITFGPLAATTLTVNSGVTLTVTNIYFNHGNTNAANTTYQTTLAGAGTINVTNMQVGDTQYPPSNLSGFVYTYVSSQVNQLTISGNVTMVSNADGSDGNNYPLFQIDNNTVSLYGQIITQNNGVLNTFPSNDPFRGRFNVGNPTTNNTNTVNFYLYNSQPIATPVAASQGVDFYLDGGSGTVTTIYAATSGTQTVYASSSYVGSVPSTYQNLTFQGGSTKSLQAGTQFSIQNNWVSGAGPVDLVNNNPTITIGTSSIRGSWVNSAVVTQGSGSITLTGDVTSSGTLTLGSGALNISGNYTNSGNFSAGSGLVTFNGTAAETLTDAGNGTQFNSVTFNNGATKTLSSGKFAVSSTGVLTVKGSSTLAAGGNLTLKSDANSSATVAAITTGNTITGNVNAQRYVSALRGYRLLSSPVYAGTDSYSNKVYSINYLKDSTFLTGTNGTAGGFDKGGNPTLYLYRENTAISNSSFLSGNFRGIKDIKQTILYNYLIDGDAGTFNLPVGNGVLFFFRGNKATVNPYVTTTVPNAATLTTSGTLNIGQVKVSEWYTPGTDNLGYTTTTANDGVRGYNLVGNPYASSIDWETFNSTTSTSGIYGYNVNNTVYEFNPVTKNYDTYQVGGSHTNKGSRTIASGQGFFVSAKPGDAAQLTFNESAKVTTQNTGLNLFMGKPADLVVNDQSLRLQLAKDSINTDDIQINFNNTANAGFVQNEDAPYKTGQGQVSLSSISNDNIALAINKLPLPKQQPLAIALKINAATDGTYQFNLADIKGLSKLFDVWLIDTYTKSSNNMRQNTTYSFNVSKSDTTTFGSKRFSLVIRQNSDYAYKLLGFTASKASNEAVQLKWTTENEENYTNFTVERSIDNGKTFDVIGSAPSNAGNSYGLLDKSPVIGQNLYRLKQEDLNNTITYSSIITVAYSGKSNNLVKDNISVYPNPAKTSISLTIDPKSNAVTTYKIEIANSFGLLVKQSTTSQAVWQSDVNDLLPGTYIVKVFNNSDHTLVGNTKLVKL